MPVAEPTPTSVLKDGVLSDTLITPSHRSIFEALLKSLVLGNGDKLCVGFHGRLAEDVRGPVVRVEATDTDWKMVRDRNSALCFHTLNHVIDSLCYVDRKRTTSRITIAVTFEKNGEDEAQLKKITKAIPRARLETVRVRTAVPNVITNPNASADKLLEDSWSALLEPANQILNRIGAQHIWVNYRAVMAALIQLAGYAEKYGRFTYVIMERPSDPWGVVIGVTIIATRALSGKGLTEASALVSEQAEAIAATLRYPRETMGFGVKFLQPSLQSSVPAELLDRLCQIYRPHITEDELRSFVSFAGNLCDERSEGRELQFGVLLGNPALMQFWHGRPSTPLAYRVDGNNEAIFFPFDSIAKQIHLLEGPADRCIVLPLFNRTMRGENPNVPAWVMEFEDLDESLTGSGEIALWDQEFAPYLFLTRRFKWALGAVVGPHSEIRLFGRGGLVAYRDGKGWYLPTDLTHLPRFNRNLSAANQARVVALVSVAAQMSRFYRRGGHGGILAHVGFHDQHEFWREADQQGWIRRLDAPEPVLFDPEGERPPELWLRRKQLLSPDNGVDVEVARRVLRASLLDGAIVTCGDRAMVKEFAASLNFEAGATFPVRGTKRLGGAKFVWFFKKFEEKYGISEAAAAVVVSSDGPMTLFVNQRGDALQDGDVANVVSIPLWKLISKQGTPRR